MADIFISHSTAQADTFGKEVRDGIVNALIKQKFDVFIDIDDKESIKPGDNWREKITNVLKKCQGAVILLSKAALDSDFVVFESSILVSRTSEQQDFILIPVLLEGVTPEDTKTGKFLPLQIYDFQFIQLKNPIVDVESAKQELIQRVVACFKPEDFGISIDDCMRRWVEDIIVCLKEIHYFHLHRAAQFLSQEIISSTLHTEILKKKIAYGLTHTPDSYSINMMIAEVAKNMSDKDRERLFWLTEPCLVNEEAACNIRPVILLEQEKRYLAINTDNDEMGKRYVHRATYCADDVHYLEISDVTGIDYQKEIFDMLIGGSKSIFSIDDDEGDEEVIDLLKSDEAKKCLIFVLVTQGMIQKHFLDIIVKIINKLCLSVTFVLISGREFPDNNDLRLANLELIRPELTDQEEKKVKRAYNTLRKNLRQNPTESNNP